MLSKFIKGNKKKDVLILFVNKMFLEVDFVFVNYGEDEMSEIFKVDKEFKKIVN